MKRFTTMIYDRMKPIQILIAAVMSAAVAGCSMVYDNPSGPCVPSDEQVYLQFRIVNNTIGDRNADSRVDYTYEEASGAENYIGLEDKDFRLYVFDGADASSKLIAAYTPDLSSSDNNYASYSVKIGIDRNKIEQKGEFVDFHIVCLANWQGTGATPTAWPSVTPGTTTRQDLHANTSLFALPQDSGEAYSWTPNLVNGEEGKRIPMFGFRTYNLNKALLDKTTFSSPYNLNVNTIGDDDGCLYMLRAMARLDVIDNIARAEGSEFPKITSVKLTNWNLNGHCINNNLEGSDTKSQVSQPRVPSGKTTIAQPLNFVDIDCSLPAPYEGKDCLTAYLPELRIRDNVPYLYITIQYDAEGNKVIEHQLNILGQGFADWNEEIRRNYIYRVAVTTSTSFIDLDASVMPWVIRKNNIEF